MVSLSGIPLCPLNVTHGSVTGFHQVLPTPEELFHSVLGPYRLSLSLVPICIADACDPVALCLLF